MSVFNQLVVWVSCNGVCCCQWAVSPGGIVLVLASLVPTVCGQQLLCLVDVQHAIAAGVFLTLNKFTYIGY